MIKANKRKLQASTILFMVCMAFPAVSHILIFWLGGNLTSVTMAFTDYYSGEFTLDNFKQAWILFTETKGTGLEFAFGNTVKFFLMGLLSTFLAMYAAYLLYKKTVGYRFSRIILYLPAAVCGLVMARLFNQFGMSDGPLGSVMEKLGLPMNGTSLMTNPDTALGAIIFYDIWVGLGGGLIYYYAAMNRIPPSLTEYAHLEGIGPIKEFFIIVLPLIWPTVVTMITLQITGFFGSSGSVLVFTQGKYQTMTIAYWMYHIVNTGLHSYFHLANAAGLVFLVLTIPLLVVGRVVMNKFGQEVEY